MGLPVLNNQRPDLCGPCGGKCCKKAPGAYFPADFGSNATEIGETITGLLHAGEIAIDISRDAGSIIRPRVKSEKNHFMSSGWGQCARLTDSGCSLEHDRRPTQCRALTPGRAEGANYCTVPAGFSDHDAVAAWAPYQDLFETLTNEARKCESPKTSP